MRGDVGRECVPGMLQYGFQNLDAMLEIWITEPRPSPSFAAAARRGISLSVSVYGAQVVTANCSFHASAGESASGNGHFWSIPFVGSCSSSTVST